ncbi:MAG: TolC family protein [Desulfuromonadaceae bacterium]|nr:TolC family protein [Desulfuromonas sp.]MDY0185601.1 TolC family protein [Desulfuromonadaceae bacterium]
MHLTKISTLMFFVLVPLLSWGAIPMTLEQCVQRGLDYNPEINAYQYASEEADRGIEEAWGAFLPTFSLNYSYNKLRNNADNERDNDYLNQNSDSFSTRLSQPLFTGFSGIAGLKHARANKEYRDNELLYIKNRLIRKINSSYYDLLYAQRRIEQWQESVGRLEEQQEIATAWVEQRLAPQLRLHEVAAELSNARYELSNALSDQAIARAQLREWLALHPSEHIDISGTLDALPERPREDLKYYILTALEQRPEVQLSSLSIDMAQQDAQSILARNLPRAEIDAAWTDYTRDYSDSKRTSDERDYYSLTLNLSMRPFQGGRNIAAYRKQRIAVERYRQQLANQRNTIVTEVNTSFERLIQGFESIKDAKKTIEHASAAYDVATESAEMGMYSLEDLLDAELRLTRAELKLTHAYSTVQQAQSELDYALGTSVRVWQAQL